MSGCLWEHHPSDNTLDPPEDQPSKGAMKLAHQAFAKHNKLRYYSALVHRAATSVTSVALPLGVAMLFIKPAAVIPFYLFAYVAPAAACMSFKQLVTSPVLFITGASARGPARLVQAVATLVLLLGVVAAYQECRDDMVFSTGGVVPRGTPGRFAHFMVHWGPYSLLNKAAVPIICGANGLDPLARAGTRVWFNLYVLGVTMTALLWVPVACVEAAGWKLCHVTRPEEHGEIVSLARRITHARTVDEIEQLECRVPGVKVQPEERLWVGVTVLMTLLDMFVLDFVAIFNLVMTYNTQFAGTLTAISIMSLGSELLSGNIFWLLHDARAAITRGVMPDRLLDLIAVEQGYEAPLSLAVTVYTFPFSVTGWWTLCAGLGSMAVSIYGCADYGLKLVEEHALDETPLLEAERSVEDRTEEEQWYLDPARRWARAAAHAVRAVWPSCCCLSARPGQLVRVELAEAAAPLRGNA